MATINTTSTTGTTMATRWPFWLSSTLAYSREDLTKVQFTFTGDKLESFLANEWANNRNEAPRMRIWEPPNPWSTWFLTYSSLSVSRYGGNDIIRLTTWQAQPQRKGGSFKSLIQNARERSEQITYCIVLYYMKISLRQWELKKSKTPGSPVVAVRTLLALLVPRLFLANMRMLYVEGFISIIVASVWSELKSTTVFV